jgi:hypothetical protein
MLHKNLSPSLSIYNAKNMFVTIQQNIKGVEDFPNFFGNFYGFRQKKVKKI